MAGGEKYTKKIKCQVCSHEFNAVFSKEDSDANEIEYCVVCGARDFKFIGFRGKTKKEVRGVERK